jgi:hypothetical protein
MERRGARSSRRSEALHLLLCRSREKLRVRAITLGSVSGSLLVGVGARPGEDLARVAALGADVDAGKEVSERVATWRLHADEGDFLLTSLGGVMDADLGAGVRRIVSETAQAE